MKKLIAILFAGFIWAAPAMAASDLGNILEK